MSSARFSRSWSPVTIVALAVAAKAMRQSSSRSGDETAGGSLGSSSTSACGGLSLEGESERVVLGHVVARPQPVEQVEPEVATERLLDDFAVSFARPRRADLHRAQDVLIDRQGRSRLRHIGIIASWRR